MSPTLSGLPDKLVPVNGRVERAIDPWAYAEDAEDVDPELSFHSSDMPDPSCGASIDGNSLIAIRPVGRTSSMEVGIVRCETSAA